MNGKTKIVAAVAAGAVALTIGAGAARCSMDAPDAQNGQQAPQEQASGKQDDAKASQSSRQAPDERQPSESEFSSLANTSWTSRDGASKLSITKDALIERTADSASVIYYTVSDEKTDAAGLSVTLERLRRHRRAGRRYGRAHRERGRIDDADVRFAQSYLRPGRQGANRAVDSQRHTGSLRAHRQERSRLRVDSRILREGAFALRNVGSVGRRGLDRLRRAQHLDHVHAR